MKPSTTIFYVDDDVDDLDFFVEASKKAEVDVHTFTCGDSLIRQINNPPPAPRLIFLDLNMPLKSGFEVISEIRAKKKFSTLPLVVFSTSSNPDDIERCRDLGANFYIQKVASFEELTKIISYVSQLDWNKFDSTGRKFIYRD